MRNFFIDFAWPHKKKAIEIDGSQHTRYEEQIERDKRKNQCFKDKGWEFIRVPWKEFFNNTKQTIIKLNTFIGK